RFLALSAVDPANPYGWLLPWPTGTGEAGPTPRRQTQAHVVLADGALVLYLDRGGRRLRSFVPPEARELLLGALRALSTGGVSRPGRPLRIEEVDGAAARTARILDLFREADFSAD